MSEPLYLVRDVDGYKPYFTKDLRLANQLFELGAVTDPVELTEIPSWFVLEARSDEDK